MVDIPKFDFGVGGGGQEEVARVRKEAEGVDGFGVGFPGVDEFGGVVVLLRSGLCSEVYIEVLWYVHVSSILVVESGGPVELGGLSVGEILLVVRGEFSYRSTSRRNDGFLQILLLARQLCLIKGILIFLEASPRSLVCTFTVNDACIAPFLSFPWNCWVHPSRRCSRRAIAPSSGTGQITDISTTPRRIHGIAQALKCPVMRTESCVANCHLLGISGQGILSLQRIALGAFVGIQRALFRACWSISNGGIGRISLQRDVWSSNDQFGPGDSIVLIARGVLVSQECHTGYS